MTAASSPQPRDGEVYRCSQEPHPGVEFYGEDGGCAECDFRPAAPSEPPAADSPTPGTHEPACPICNGQHFREAHAAPSPVGTTEPAAEGKIDWSQHRGSCRIFYAERRCTCIGTEPPVVTQQGGGLCNDRGPRIGSEGTPRCRRPLGHDGPHRPAEEDGWGMAMSWGNLSTAALAARPSADAETLRRVRELADDLALHTVEPSNDRGVGFIAGLDHAAGRIRAVLDGGR